MPKGIIKYSRGIYEEMPAPTVSVIVTAHKRKEFLVDAIKSVLSQDVDQGAYEIIVVKNFSDSNIEEFFKANAVRVFDIDNSSLGAKLAVGIRNARGKILSFLDDDDLWESNKLGRVLQAFSVNNKLCYYNNNRVTIDQQGNFVTSLNRRDNETIKSGEIKITNKSNDRDYRRLFKCDPDSNLSSSSALREILLKNIDKIDEANATLDSWIFYICMCSGMEILLDSRKLTRYRLNKGSVSRPSESEGYFSYLQRSTREYGKILDFVKPFENSEVTKNINRQLIEQEIKLGMFVENVSKEEIVFELFRFLKTIRKENLVRSGIIILILILQFFSPPLSRRIHYKTHFIG